MLTTIHLAATRIASIVFLVNQYAAELEVSLVVLCNDLEICQPSKANACVHE